MKVNEIIDPSLEEGWKEKLAALGVAGALGLGGAAYKNQDKEPGPGQVSVGKVQNAPKVDVNKLASVLPGPAQLLKTYALKSGIKGEELVQLLAQAQHETLNFTRTEEVGSKRYFRQYDPKHNPRKAKMLGNTRAGDGERYKGRGFLQITGRWNYRAAGQALGLPLEEKPELLNRPEIAAKVSVWYWKTFVKPDVNSFSDVKDVTKEINPGLQGLDDRQTKFQNLMKVASR